MDLTEPVLERLDGLDKQSGVAVGGGRQRSDGGCGTGEVQAVAASAAAGPALDPRGAGAVLPPRAPLGNLDQ